MTLSAQLEAILFVSGEPVALLHLARLCDQSPPAIEAALFSLEARLSTESGLALIRHDGVVELVTHPHAAELVRRILAQEAPAELSKASLEVLSILAYRGPLTRPELEQIRGVQSTIILRTLLMRGLVEMHADTRLGQPMFQVTIDFMKHLGLRTQEDLPDFDRLRAHTTVEQILDELEHDAE